MRILIVYYSWTGNTEQVARRIAELCEADIEVITELRKRGGLLGWLRGGFEALFRKDPDIEPTKADLSSYDLVAIGTPVWANLAASPTHKFLVREKDNIKAFALFCTYGGTGAEKALAAMAKLVGLSPKATLDITESALNDHLTGEKIAAFAASLKAAES